MLLSCYDLQTDFSLPTFNVSTLISTYAFFSFYFIHPILFYFHAFLIRKK